MLLPRIHFSPQKSQPTDAAIWSPRFSQSLHLRRCQDRTPVLNINHQPTPNLDNATGFVTHFIFFLLSNLFLRSDRQPAGSGGGGGASGAGVRTRATDGVSGGGIDGRPKAPGVRAAAAFLSLSRHRGVPNTSDLVVETEGSTDVASWGGGIEA